MINFVMIIISSSSGSFLRFNFKIYKMISHVISAVTTGRACRALCGTDSVP